MARSGEEIQHALLTFGRRWVEYAGSERAEAQTFLNELFARTGRSIGRTPDELQRFLMQAVWCMFAEDLQMLRDYPFQKIVRRLIADRTRSSSAELGLLLRVLNQKGSHNRKDVLEGTTTSAVSCSRSRPMSISTPSSSPSSTRHPNSTGAW